MTGKDETQPFDISEALDKLSESKNSQQKATNQHNHEGVLFSDEAQLEQVLEDVWPAPSFRTHQKETIMDILTKFYVKNNDVVTLSAPTGAGKSLIIYAVSKVISRAKKLQSFVTTPLNSLIDQIEEDNFIKDVTTIKGKNNYQCVHPRDKGTAVGNAVCQREKDFDCSYKDDLDTNGGCPYYGRKHRAQNTDIAVTNLSYLMTNSMIPEEYDARFESRDLLAIDETQNIEAFALNFIGFTIDRRNIPINFKNVDNMPQKGCDMVEMVNWLKQVLNGVTERLMELQDMPRTTKEQNKDEETLQNLRHRMINFIEDFDKGRHWTKTRDGSTLKFEPVFIDRFTDRFLWEQCDKVLLSSATIPKGDFLDAIGLGEKSVAHVEVPSTFPTENRPVITREMVGKMTKDERDSTIPKMADKITEIADFHAGENGFIHCHSYSIMERLYDNLPKYVQRRTMMQDKDDRMGSLTEWYESSEQIFLSVGMAEGISLDDDTARWQVVAKASYPFLGDERVSYRVNDMGDWEWFNNQAIIDLQQAVGRGVRSKDDSCVCYLLDSSFKSLLNQNKNLFENWFLDSVDCQTDMDVYSDSTFDLSA